MELSINIIKSKKIFWDNAKKIFRKKSQGMEIKINLRLKIIFKCCAICKIIFLLNKNLIKAKSCVRKFQVQKIHFRTLNMLEEFAQ